MTQTDGGPGYPMIDYIDHNRGRYLYQFEGMSKREKFAKAAMQPLVANMKNPENYACVVAKMAFVIADAMLAESAKREAGRGRGDGEA